MQKNHKRGVIGIVFSEDRSQVLVLKRRDVPIWVLPGGAVEPHESPEEAVVREVYEETGLQVAIQRHVATYLPVNKLAHPTYVFECTRLSGAPVVGSETCQIGFFSVDALPAPFFFLHRSWMEQAGLRLSQPIQKFLTEVNYWNLFKYFCRNPLQVFRLLLSRLGKPYNTK